MIARWIDVGLIVNREVVGMRGLYMPKVAGLQSVMVLLMLIRLSTMRAIHGIVYLRWSKEARWVVGMSTGQRRL